MSTSSTALNGRARAMAHRRGHLASAAAPQETMAAPMPAEKPIEKPVETVASSASFLQVSPERKAQAGKAVVVAEGREAAKQRRQQQVKGTASSGSSANGANRPQPRTKPKPEPILPSTREASTGDSGSLTPRSDRTRDKSKDKPKGIKSETSETAMGRKLARAWRQAQGKGRAAQEAYKSIAGQSGAMAKLSNPDASTRDIARQVRAERCSKGKKSCSAVSADSTDNRRQSRKRPAPEKVVFSETLSGQAVSGASLATEKMTGLEAGLCKGVTGTEYLGAETFAKGCSTQPKAAPAKVTQTQTTRGQTISGTKVGRDKSVSGDLAGQCQAVTGTEYLPADQSSLFCQKPGNVPAAPAKVTERTNLGNRLLNDASTSSVTGADRLVFTNRNANKPAKAPTKVAESSTFAGNKTTGTQVGRGLAVTGDESGYCKHVTGTGYQGREEVEQVCQTSLPKVMPTKVAQSVTAASQLVSGERAGKVSGATGSEAGSCQAVTGTPYMGMETFAQSCSTEHLAKMQSRQPSVMKNSGMGGKAISGTQPGMQGLTGAQKGACELVTGTHYHGVDQVGMMCQTANAAEPGESDFPVMMAADPIVNRFAPTAPMAPMASPMQAAMPAQPEVSKITGDGWDRGSKVTGTDGPFATARNPSIKGRGMQPAASAANYRPSTTADIPMSPITGSSGNSDSGAKVTLSGGARA
ncbi:CsoS2 family carboxysome shell protein [Thiosulfativibrio zosterae]|uniref:Carboxysome shell protein n=1 Tax=Thiosulfativibrio zosterae TaxID=2675053 RepID=A0A6F8PQ14_9GAMM|nr:CsoS2 family carboxysome shell protein [Thiosulfativibrio zosterae]BBP44128.1 hypothetical protein THMIRHAT_18740 [Thiosulfativibrio zosterae]